MNIDFLHNLDDTGRHNLVLLRCDSNSLKDTIDQLKNFGIIAVNICKELSKEIVAVESTKKEWLGMHIQNIREFLK